MDEAGWNIYVEIALETRLRRQSGNAFQGLFSDVMERLHDDFIRIQPLGSLGDEGIDGYFKSGNVVHQCYGAQNGHVAGAKGTHKKIVDDFKTIVAKHPETEVWKFTHNIVDGLPTEFLNAISEMELLGKPLGIKVEHYGPKQFLDEVVRLKPHELERVLGVRAIEADRLERLPHELNAIVSGIMAEVDAEWTDPGQAKPVPVEKFELNAIPPHWKKFIKQALADAPLAEECIARFGDAKAADVVPKYFKDRYVEMKLAGETSPGKILNDLHNLLVARIAGLDVNGARDYAGYVMLAAMFESCQIFEDKKDSNSSEQVHDLAL